MVDALGPASETLSSAVLAGASLQDAVRACAAAAVEGAEATAAMMPRLGRASYLGDRVLGFPDGGAVAVQIWLNAVCTALAKKEI